MDNSLERFKILSSLIYDLQKLIKSEEIKLILNESGNHRSIINRRLDDSPYLSGDCTWMLFSSVIVLFMTLPGISLFYGGMVATKQSFTATAKQILSIICVVSALWFFVGYSIAFGPYNIKSGYPIVGDFSMIFLNGIVNRPRIDLASTIPESLYCMFQLTFAIITPALICGSFAERMKFVSLLLFIGLWHLFVYCPIAHANWHPSGILFQTGVLDFAGGNVVHISSGMAALVASIVVGKGFGKVQLKPHNLVLTLVGCASLWIGWFGFNAGSAVAASNRAGLALVCTHLAASLGGLSWMATTWAITGKPSILAMASGVVSGLVAITPAAGYVDPTGAFVIGILSGPICYLGANIKHMFGFDDSLDAFGIHAVGGVLGGLMTGLFAKAEICGINGAFYGNPEQMKLQLYGILFTLTYSTIVSYIILKGIDLTIGLRVKIMFNSVGRHNQPASEQEKLKATSHGLSPSSPLRQVSNQKGLQIDTQHYFPKKMSSENLPHMSSPTIRTVPINRLNTYNVHSPPLTTDNSEHPAVGSASSHSPNRNSNGNCNGNNNNNNNNNGHNNSSISHIHIATGSGKYSIFSDYRGSYTHSAKSTNNSFERPAIERPSTTSVCSGKSSYYNPLRQLSLKALSPPAGGGFALSGFAKARSIRTIKVNATNDFEEYKSK